MFAKNRRVIVKRVSAPQLSLRPAHLPAPKVEDYVSERLAGSHFRFQISAFDSLAAHSLTRWASSMSRRSHGLHSAFVRGRPLPAIRHPRAHQQFLLHPSAFILSFRQPERVRADLPPRCRRHADGVSRETLVGDEQNSSKIIEECFTPQLPISRSALRAGVALSIAAHSQKSPNLRFETLPVK